MDWSRFSHFHYIHSTKESIAYVVTSSKTAIEKFQNQQLLEWISLYKCTINLFVASKMKFKKKICNNQLLHLVSMMLSIQKPQYYFYTKWNEFLLPRESAQKRIRKPELRQRTNEKNSIYIHNHVVTAKKKFIHAKRGP